MAAGEQGWLELLSCRSHWDTAEATGTVGVTVTAGVTRTDTTRAGWIAGASGAKMGQLDLISCRGYWCVGAAGVAWQAARRAVAAGFSSAVGGADPAEVQGLLWILRQLEKGSIIMAAILWQQTGRYSGS